MTPRKPLPPDAGSIPLASIIGRSVVATGCRRQMTAQMKKSVAANFLVTIEQIAF